jgi:hypothetical protein
MPPTIKPSHFEVFDRMCKTDDQALRLAPLSEIISAQKTKRGTQILIGFGADVVNGLMRDEFVGGLLLVDRKRFEEVKAAMERELSTEKE